MGIVDRNLSEFELSEFDSCYIEYNINGTIHVHMDGLRVEFSRREFEHFVTVISEGRETLVERKASTEVQSRENGASLVVPDAVD